MHAYLDVPNGERLYTEIYGSTFKRGLVTHLVSLSIRTLLIQVNGEEDASFIGTLNQSCLLQRLVAKKMKLHSLGTLLSIFHVHTY